MVTRASRFSHSGPILDQLHCLHVIFLIHIKICTITLRTLKQPEYLTYLFGQKELSPLFNASSLQLKAYPSLFNASSLQRTLLHCHLVPSYRHLTPMWHIFPAHIAPHCFYVDLYHFFFAFYSLLVTFSFLTFAI